MSKQYALVDQHDNIEIYEHEDFQVPFTAEDIFDLIELLKEQYGGCIESLMKTLEKEGLRIVRLETFELPLNMDDLDTIEELKRNEELEK